MNDSKFQEWLYGLPVWAESDNYVYFLMAILFISFLKLDGDVLVNLIVMVVTGLVMKGRGNGGPKT